MITKKIISIIFFYNKIIIIIEPHTKSACQIYNAVSLDFGKFPITQLD